MGINRVSIGAQSFINKELKVLGRIHSVKQIEACFNSFLKYGISNISLDLIYGLPFQKKEDLYFSLHKIAEFSPKHISTYCLSLEMDVPLFKLKKHIPSDETLSEFYFEIIGYLKKNRYQHYEISSFSEINYHSRHNLAYWDYKSFLGVGAGAAGFINNSHYRNPNSLKEYYRLLDKEEIAINFVPANQNELISEFIFLSLRKTEGLNSKNFRKRFNQSFEKKYSNILNSFIDSGYMEKKNDFYKLTPKAYFISDYIFSEFMN